MPSTLPRRRVDGSQRSCCWVLANEAYVGRVHWRDQTFPGLHEPLIDQVTFDRAQALLKERGEDLDARARRPRRVSAHVACCAVDAAAAHTSACPPKATAAPTTTTPAPADKSSDAKAATASGSPSDKLETAILDQLTSLYRHGGLIRDAIQQAAASDETDRDALTEQRASLAKEISRTEHAIERYQDAFETGDLSAARFTERLSSLDARLDSLRGQDQALARDLAADAPTTPDTAALHAVADQLGQVIETGDPDQAKALLRILIAELRVNSRNEILPTYRVGAPVVCAQTSSVELVGIEPTTSAMPWRRSPS